MKIFKIILLSNILLLILGCDKNEDYKLLKGNIVGFVKLIDETGNNVKDKSDVNVSIEGLANSASTIENGRFELIDVPAGTYDLNYNKSGYGTDKSYNYQFVGGNVPAFMYEKTLYQLPTIEIQNLDVSFNDNTIKFSVEISETTHYSYKIFFNDSPDVSYLNYKYSSIRFSTAGDPVTQFEESIHLNSTPFLRGDKIYMVIYFININEEAAHFDKVSNDYIYASYKEASHVIHLLLIG